MITRRSLSNESGVALVTAMLVVMLMSALMVGMFAALTTDTRSHAADRDQTQAYAAAQAGLEKLTSALAQLFNADASPSVAQINAIAATPPVLQNFSFKSPGGVDGSGYAVTWTADAQGNPAAVATSITTGPYTGFQGLITKYTATITASSKAGAEVRLRREIQTVAVPVFQFGVFSESDLTFYAGDAFNFGGRVHTNGNLFACEFGTSLTFADRITAVGEAVHNTLSNTLAASAVGCTGTTNIATSPGVYRNWLMTEGSVTGMPGSPANPSWGTISNGTYRNYIRTGATGAKRLDLPLVSQGAQPIDLIRRPRINSGENVANPQVFGQRFYSQASLRILLSDRVNDIMSLPGVSATAPVSLDWDAGVPAGYVVDATHPPLARSVGPASFQTNASQYFNGGMANIYYNAGVGAGTVWKMPATFTVRNTATNATTTFQCNGKTGVNAIPAAQGPGAYVAYPANALVGCTAIPALVAALAAPLRVEVTVNGIQINRTVIGGIATGTTNIQLSAAGGVSDTAPFSQNLLWLNSANAAVPGTAIPVTCQGYIDTGANPHFWNCIGNGLTAVVPNQTWVYTSARVNQNTNTIGGFIKIERQNNAGVWTDITMEILNLGIGGRNVAGVQCADPTPNAILRIQRLADNGGGSCSVGETRNPWDWWPNTLYDTREGSFRDTATNAPMNLGGVMQYIALDVNNLRLWLAGTIPGTGNQAVNNNGYMVYFSDRRGDHNETNADVETAEYGFEDQVNPTVAGCCSPATPPDNVLQPGENMNFVAGAPVTQELYGETPHPLVVPPAAAIPLSPYDANGRPWTPIRIDNGNAVQGPGEGMARMSKVVLFRRALKLINGGINGGVNSLPASGLTVASENPVYVQGNYNATTVATAEPNVPAAIMADAITLLSNNWSDAVSFESPTLATNRNATTTGYRFAAVAGKGISFPYCAANCGNPAGAPTAQPGFLYGTDGGVGNFLRLLEDWNVAGVSINYRGSLISLFTSRQAIGTFKFNTNVYDFGTRVFTFDDDFLTPSLLPPGTPMFRDVNTLKFRQILRPNQ